MLYYTKVEFKTSHTHIVDLLLNPATHAPETGTKNLHEKFHASLSQFLAPEKWRITYINDLFSMKSINLLGPKSYHRDIRYRRELHTMTISYHGIGTTISLSCDIMTNGSITHIILPLQSRQVLSRSMIQSGAGEEVL